MFLISWSFSIWVFNYELGGGGEGFVVCDAGTYFDWLFYCRCLVLLHPLKHRVVSAATLWPIFMRIIWQIGKTKVRETEELTKHNVSFQNQVCWVGGGERAWHKLHEYLHYIKLNAGFSLCTSIALSFIGLFQLQLLSESESTVLISTLHAAYKVTAVLHFNNMWICVPQQQNHLPAVFNGQVRISLTTYTQL